MHTRPSHLRRFLALFAVLMTAAGCESVTEPERTEGRGDDFLSSDAYPGLDPSFAVDVSFWSGELSGPEVACWRDAGVDHVIVGTQNTQIAAQQLSEAVAAGMTVDAYVMLYWQYDMSAQVRSALSAISSFPVRRLWLDAEQPADGRSASTLVSKIQQAVDACGSFSCGIYTRKVWWRDNVANSSAFSHLPIWYAYYDGQADFSDWYEPQAWYEGPFGGWSDPTGKQYDSDWTAPDLCGVNVDYNVMFVEAAGDDDDGDDGPPPAPTGLSPSGGATITTASVTLSADAVAGATGYQFAIQYESGGVWRTYYTYTSDDNTQTFWPVYDDTKYRWRIRAGNAHGWSAWSGWARFDFGNVGGPPPAPTGLSPTGGVTITTGSVTMSCNAVTGATSYEFAIEYLSGGVWRTYYTYSSDSNAKTFWPVHADTTYRWRVRARNGHGWGAWSGWAEFYFAP
ncbi:MAG: hypothetical protein GWN99_13805 [Gemmatimonadetes bacterium]|uniref:Fibronectin type-III domain-containing protein n=1 Tax=Candidatus Kutchimonas denitrificans TaxID=3056748 RepID=A0AAE4Z9W2_9BACT|nr:hypothetical protein [Gemmatimonadota bacterium]NIR75964.1 hypothetical protein [Candidatus Kutchimonas denitrificans]NIS02121.1 hypothetical protein [Gemmatimonadota bacterium]NIT67946.1 hypothetical protein [Gemmatimonadota bacterium]NIU53940.1 hypothetical protein [Gemmatimonadota bacterium]